MVKGKPKRDSSRTGTKGRTGLANPAAVYAIKKGKAYKIKTDKTGNQRGVVVLRSGREIDEWDYYYHRKPNPSTINTSTLRRKKSKTIKQGNKVTNRRRTFRPMF